MSGTTKITTTKTEGWQTICQNWAQARESFEIHGIGAKHLAYCKELCDSNQYQCRYQFRNLNSAAVFAPLSA